MAGLNFSLLLIVALVLVPLSWAIPVLLFALRGAKRGITAHHVSGLYAILMALVFICLVVDFQNGNRIIGPGQGNPTLVFVLIGLGYLISGWGAFQKRHLLIQVIYLLVLLTTVSGSLLILGKPVGFAIRDWLSQIQAVLMPIYYTGGAPFLIAPPAVVIFLLAEMIYGKNEGAGAL